MDVHVSWKPPTRTIKWNKAKTLRKCSEANGIAAKSGIRAPNQPFQTPASSVIHSPSGSKTVRTFRESIKHHDNAHMEINGWLVHKNEQVIHCFPFVHDFSLRMGDYDGLCAVPIASIGFLDGAENSENSNHTFRHGTTQIKPLNAFAVGFFGAT